MRKILVVITSLLAINAWAEIEEGRSAILVNFGMAEGGPSLGADFEHAIHRTFGVGGYVRMHPDESPSAQNPAGEIGVMAFGGFIRPHFNRQNWDFSVAPGFGIVQVDPAGGGDDETLLGPSFLITLMYEYSRDIAFGVEHSAFHGWFGEELYVGGIMEELHAKFRFAF